MSIADELLQAEARTLVKRYYPNGKGISEFLAKAEKHRGKEATQQPREATRKEWVKYTLDIGSQG